MNSCFGRIGGGRLFASILFRFLVACDFVRALVRIAFIPFTEMLIRLSVSLRDFNVVFRNCFFFDYCAT